MTRASHAEAARWFVPFLEHASDPVLGARAHVMAAWIAALSGRLPESRAMLAHAGDFAGRAPIPGIEAYVRVVRGLIEITEGRGDATVELARATLADPAADSMCRSWALVNLGLVAFLGGDMEACAAVGEEGIALCQSAGESWTRVVHLHLLSLVRWERGDAAGGVSLLLDALGIDRRLDDVWHRSWTIEGMAWMTVDLGRYERAARLLGIAAGCWEFAGTTITAPWRGFHDTALAELRRRLGESRFTREFEAGRQLDPVRALSFALEDADEGARPAVESPRVSQRELEVAALVAEGHANREIAERLFLSPRTVETHVQHLMDKLGVGSRSEIAAWHAREVAAKLGA
jgi:DNA-binding CsgD family transcriptional regulator